MALFEYSEGVANPGANDLDLDSGVHVMLLIGSGQEDGFSYWLLRNSFGVNWGSTGHLKLDHNSPALLTVPLGMLSDFSLRDNPDFNRVYARSRSARPG